ncbi:zinc finger, RING/FYVE/PHD-type containing protein [Tanacetum coccineum]|uniref:Zinc finger, RING/FYVE/PHD-type containing protein n=1 Tax=Tanacetum coccineum TaxID=301880 RepID=A0ABQ5H075_9ASTR
MESEEEEDIMESEEEEDIMESEEEEDIMESEEEEDIMESEEEEDIMESKEKESKEEEDEEEAEQLEEMRPPVVTSWMGPDGITVHGIIYKNDGITRLKNRCQLDDCLICYKPSTTHGKHQICCLPCGHMYGFSCIKKWLLLSSSSGKCPQCNTLCSFQDAILLYPTHLCVTAHEKASSATLFPFTEQGFLEFKNYEYSRMLDAQLLRAADITHMNILRAESLGLADALQRRASLLEPRVELRRRTDALERLVSALRRRMDALVQRSDAFEKKKLAEKAAAKAKKKGEKEAEKVPEKKLKHKEKKDEKKMQASGTVVVPEEEMVEDVAEEPEEEKVEVKDKQTTKTTERVRVRSRSRSNSGKGTDSISKVILKCKKSNNYMY